MYKIIRKKVAASVNSVDVPEQFEWGKWLRPSETDSVTISKINSSLSGIKADLSFNLPENSSFNFQTKKVKLYKSRKLSSFPKEKTIKVFYKLGKSSTRKIKIFEADSGKIIFSSSFGKITDNTEEIREINVPSGLDNLKYINEITEAFLLLSSEATSTSISFQTAQPRTRELSLNTSNSKINNIKTQIKRPGSKSFFKEIELKLLESDIIRQQFFLEKSIAEKIFQPAFKFLNEIPSIETLDVSNVNQLIEQLDKDESSKKTIIIPIEYLGDKPSIQNVTLFNSEKPKILAYSYEIDNREKTRAYSNNALLKNKISTYTYLFRMDRTKILEESFERIQKDYSCDNWNIPLSVEDTILNPQQEIEENENISFDDALTEEIEKPANDDSFEETISKILKPEVIQAADVSINDEYLYNYQKEGAKLLASNKNVLLCDELGLGKTFQVISALKALYKISAVSKILIICNPGDIGDTKINEGWAGKLTELAAEIPFTVINKEDEENKVRWPEDKNLFITDYEIFFDIFSEDNSNLQILEKFNCFIFDEAQNLIPNQKIFKQFIELKRPATSYTWFLSDQLNFGKRIHKELNFLKNSSIIELGRNKTETYRELPDMVRQDVWHELDDDQKIEYENILSVGRERISKLLQNGNPFIIQSNVFTLLHQLKQIYNFASQKSSSAKSDHLLKQIENVIENDKKILVFSQYDKMGIQKIEQVLNTNKIKYILLHSGMSLNELEAAKKKFQISKKIHVLLNGIKSSRSGISLPTVSYVVHFDQWWNPATVWKAEANIAGSTDENINVYNYFTKNTIEEKIKALLKRRGLLRKEIIEFLSVESINEMVSLEEWLEILGIGNPLGNVEQNSDTEVTNDHVFENRLNELSLDELSKKTEILFSRLGYKNLFLNKGNYAGEINIIGTILEHNSKMKMVAKCLFSSEVDLDTIKEYLEALQNDKNLGKNFIIHFNGLEEKLPYYLKKKIILINKELFTNYLINFRLI